MNDRVAGGANRNEVMNWIDPVAAPDRGKGHHVMNMNEAISDLAKSLSKVCPADLALMSVMGNASGACQGIAFVSVHNNHPFGTFGKSGRDWSRWDTWSACSARLP